MPIIDWIVLGGIGLLVREGMKKERAEREEAAARMQQYEHEARISRNEWQRKLNVNAERLRIQCSYADGISFEEFESIAYQAKSRLQRITSLRINNGIVYCTVVSQSGATDWDFRVDFNDWGHITGTYWTKTENTDSSIPGHFGSNMSSAICQLLRDKGIRLPDYSDAVDDNGDIGTPEGFTFIRKRKKSIFRKEEPQQICCPHSSSALVDEHVYVAISLLKNAGFTNIRAIPVKDLNNNSDCYVYQVARVTLNGSDRFSAGSYVAQDAEIIIQYHEKLEIVCPYSSMDLQTQNYVVAGDKLQALGFTQIYERPIRDLVTGWVVKDGSVEKVTVEQQNTDDEAEDGTGEPVLKRKKGYPFDVKIVIHYHTFKQDRARPSHHAQTHVQQHSSTSQRRSTKGGILSHILLWVNISIMMTALLGTISNALTNGDLSTLPAVVFFGVMSFMFGILSFSPRETPCILGKRSGLPKWCFVLLCVVALPLLIAITFNATPVLENLLFNPHNSDTSAPIAYVMPSEKPADPREYLTSDGFTYYLTWNGKAVLTGFAAEPASYLRIPSELDDHEIVEIADYAFYNCAGIETVYISADIERIGNYAFAGCTGFSYISLPSGLRDIGDYAFAACTGLSSVTLWDADEIGNYAFYGCTALSSISIPSGTRKIGAHAFEGCTKLSSVTLWDADYIGDYAFYGCKKLSSVSIPTGNKRIGAHAFEGCTNLSSVTLWDAEVIAEYAFASCTKLSSISIPSGTKKIEAYAFDGCVKLRSITMWDDDTVVDPLAFSNCPNLDK